MSHRIPLAIVNFLASISADRAALPSDKTNVTMAALSPAGLRSLRFAIEGEAHWNEMVAKTSATIQVDPCTDLFLFFPTGGPVDAGIHLQPNQAPGYLYWRFDRDVATVVGPNFAMEEIQPENVGNLPNAEGVAIFQAILNAQAVPAAA